MPQCEICARPAEEVLVHVWADEKVWSDELDKVGDNGVQWLGFGGSGAGGRGLPSDSSDIVLREGG